MTTIKRKLDSSAMSKVLRGLRGATSAAANTREAILAATEELLRTLQQANDFQPEDVVLHVAPLSHGSGIYALPSIARAAKNIVYPGGSFDAEDNAFPP